MSELKDKLSDHAEIVPGYAFKSDQFTENEIDIPLVKGDNVQQGFIDWQIAKRWPMHDVEGLERYRLKCGDVVLAMDRPWVTAGLKWAYIRRGDPDCLLVQRVARLRGKPTLDQTYLRCLISSSYFANYIQPIVTGVNVPHISGKQIGDFRIPLPPLEIQRKIAGVLSAYDDLIENNRRRIAILENMAEEIYREWFVRMRFPGYQSAKFEKGVPVGWPIKTLGEIYKTASGGTPSRTDATYYTGEIPWIKTGELNNRFIHATEEAITDAALESSSAKLFPIGTVIIALYGATIGELAILGCDAATNQACAALFPIDDRYHYSYTMQLMRSIKSGLIAIAFGGAQQNISQALIRQFKVFDPPIELIDRYVEIAKPMFKAIENIQLVNTSLTQSRDALLTRLISGKLSVDELDIELPPSMTDAPAEAASEEPVHA